MTLTYDQILKGIEDARELAQMLRDGVNADIWYDTAEHRDDDALAVIERTQNAMMAAANVFDAIAALADAMQQPAEVTP